MADIVLDCRERALIDAFRRVQQEGLVDASVIHPPTVAQLPLGDIMVKDATTVILVERKTHEDLMSSLFDGRLEEQVARLEEWASEEEEGRWVVLLVEGGGGRPTGPVVVSRLRHFIKVVLQQTLRASSRRRHLVLRTADLRETVLLLLTLHKTILSTTATPPGASNNVMLRLPSRMSCTRSPTDVYLRQLCCIPGVSPARARNIQKLFPHWRALVEATGGGGGAAVLSSLARAIRSRPAAQRLVDLVVLTTADQDVDNDHDVQSTAKGRPKRQTHRRKPRAMDAASGRTGSGARSASSLHLAQDHVVCGAVPSLAMGRESCGAPESIPTDHTTTCSGGPEDDHTS